MEKRDHPVELKDYLRAVREGRFIVVGVVIVCVVLGAAFAVLQGSAYTSSGKVFVATQVQSDDPDELLQRDAIAQQRTQSYVELVGGNVFGRAIEDDLGYEFDPRDVEVSVVPGASVIEIEVTDSDRRRAQEIAEAYTTQAPVAIKDLEQVEGDGWEVVTSILDVPERGVDESARPLPVVLAIAALVGLVLGVVVATLTWVLRRELRASRDDAPSAATR